MQSENKAGKQERDSGDRRNTEKSGDSKVVGKMSCNCDDSRRIGYLLYESYFLGTRQGVAARVQRWGDS